MILFLLTHLARADIAVPMPPVRGSTWPAPALDAPPWPWWAWGSLGAGLVLVALIWWRVRRRDRLGP